MDTSYGKKDLLGKYMREKGVDCSKLNSFTNYLKRRGAKFNLEFFESLKFTEHIRDFFFRHFFITDTTNVKLEKILLMKDILEWCKQDIRNKVNMTFMKDLITNKVKFLEKTIEMVSYFLLNIEY